MWIEEFPRHLWVKLTDRQGMAELLIKDVYGESCVMRRPLPAALLSEINRSCRLGHVKRASTKEIMIVSRCYQKKRKP